MLAVNSLSEKWNNSLHTPSAHVDAEKHKRQQRIVISEPEGMAVMSALAQPIIQSPPDLTIVISNPEVSKENERINLVSYPARKYRILKIAGDNIAEIPKQMVTITNPQYKNAMGFSQEGKAYLQPWEKTFLSIDGLSYESGTGEFILNGLPASKARLKNFYTKEVPTDIDIPFLQLCYSIILTNYYNQIRQDNSITRTVGVYYPALAHAIGKSSNISRNDVEAFIKKILSFNSITGFIDGEIQPVLLYAGEDRDKNIVYFQSPYLIKVIRSLYKASIRKDKNGHEKVKKNGEPLMLPCYSWLANSALVKERNN